MEHLISKHHPGAIRFTADKVKGTIKRAEVYERLLKRFLKGYTISKQEVGIRHARVSGDSTIEFTLEKK